LDDQAFGSRTEERIGQIHRQYNGRSLVKEL
jgi:hypothetical protein